MVVITLEKCPLALRGDLTKWLQEISLGVYVGQVSARVRDNLWQRVCSECKSGRATMVYSARNEQHLNFEVHNSTWEPIDFDGIKLMLRPSPERVARKGGEGRGTNISVASRRRSAGKRGRGAAQEPSEYVVLDLETTGLDPNRDLIVEVGAIRFLLGEADEEFRAFVKTSTPLPSGVKELTGISDDDVATGFELEKVLDELLDFIGNSPLVIHNPSFDLAFLEVALERYDLEEIENEIIDTLDLARKKLPHLGGYGLGALAEYFGLDVTGAHRALDDCRTTREVLVELLRM